jgi:AcrR family transcriptional regulator
MRRSGDAATGPPVDARVVRTRNDILRTAFQVMVEQGWDAVTHAHLAQVAGYSKATVYKHWTTRTDLLREAFRLADDAPHHTPGGDLRADLIAELTAFRSAIEHRHLDRALATLVAVAVTDPELHEVRHDVVTAGERVVRALLGQVAHGHDLEAATTMLCGSVLYSAQMHAAPPADGVIAAAVDMVLHRLGIVVAIVHDRPGSG